MKKKKGFTLVEIIVVLVIMGILLAIAVPSVLGYVKKANDQKYLAFTRNVYLQAQVEVQQANIDGTLKTNQNANDLMEYIIGNLEENTYEDYSVEVLYMYFDHNDAYFQLDPNVENHSLTKLIVEYTGDGGSEKWALIKANENMSIYDSFEELSKDLN